MKRLTATLAALTVAVAVSAPTAFAANSPNVIKWGAKVSQKAAQKQSLRPSKKESVRGFQVHIAKKMAKKMSAQNV